MKLCKVIGNVWSTKKDSALEAVKLMVVRPVHASGDLQQCYVAADFVGAGIGEIVLVASGSSARHASHNPAAPIDAAIIGIVDAEEIATE